MKQGMVAMGLAVAAGVLLGTAVVVHAQPSLSPLCGTLTIQDRAAFEFYANRENFP